MRVVECLQRSLVFAVDPPLWCCSRRDKVVRAWTYLKFFLRVDEYDYPTLFSFESSPSFLPPAIAERNPEYVWVWIRAEEAARQNWSIITL